MTQAITTENAPKPVGLYPHARKAGDFLFLSGLGPRNPDGSGIPGLTIDEKGNFATFDFEAQVHSVFQNIRSVLEASGARWEQLTDITVFLVNMQRDFNTFNRIYAEYFKENQPCRTTVAVTALPVPIAIEIKCVAYLGGGEL
jgi:2-aminomuconate deaminase